MPNSSLWFASVSQNKQWLCASTSENTYLYTNLEENMNLIQTLPKSYQKHKFSTNGEYLITGQSRKLTIYKLLCNLSKGEFYNTTSNLCETCQ